MTYEGHYTWLAVRESGVTHAIWKVGKEKADYYVYAEEEKNYLPQYGGVPFPNGRVPDVCLQANLQKKYYSIKSFISVHINDALVPQGG